MRITYYEGGGGGGGGALTGGGEGDKTWGDKAWKVLGKF